MNPSERMGTEEIGQLLARFSGPAIVGTVVNGLYNVVDRIFVGHQAGASGIAAISVCFPVMMIMMAFGMLVSRGGNTLLGIRLGQKRREEAEQVLGNAFTLYLVLSAVFIGLGLLGLSPLLKLFGATPAILPPASQYLAIILLGMPLQMIALGMSNFIRGEGNPRTAMWTMFFGSGLNILLDPLFIFTFGLGIRGAALATVLAQSVSAAYVLHYFLGGRSALKLRRAFLPLRVDLVRRIAAIGAPPFVMIVGASMIMAVLNNRLRFYGGDVALSVMGVIFSVQMLVRMPLIGLSQGAQPILSFNYGALHYGRVRQTLKTVLIWATAMVVLASLAVELRPRLIFHLFSPHDLPFAQMGASAIRIFLLMLPLFGIQMAGTNYFQAVGRARVAMLLTLCRQGLILIPLVLVLPLFLGLQGIWYAMPIADVVSTLLVTAFLLRELRLLGAGTAAEQG
jgi:putative MATE family efflux protein